MKKFKPAILTLMLLTFCFAPTPSIALSETESTEHPKSEYSSYSSTEIDPGTLPHETRSIDPGMLVNKTAEIDSAMLLPGNPDIDLGILVTP